MHENQIATHVVDSCFRVHTKLGPGLFESVYESALVFELSRLGFRLEAQKPFDVIYEGQNLGLGFKADIIVEDRLIVEIKSVEAMSRVHKKQLKTYLVLTEKKLGLLVNFGAELLKDGIHRVVNGLPE